jgi:nucleotide-binding universal stress UspA family protein
VPSIAALGQYNSDRADHGAAARHALVEAARRRRANLIVMSRRFRSSLGRMSDGAVAESVVRRAPTPVLLVAPPATTELLASPRVSSEPLPRAVNV